VSLKIGDDPQVLIYILDYCGHQATGAMRQEVKHSDQEGEGTYHETGYGKGKGPLTIGDDSKQESDYSGERLVGKKGGAQREKVVTPSQGAANVVEALVMIREPPTTAKSGEE
jgi:hypothetical protein